MVFKAYVSQTISFFFLKVIAHLTIDLLKAKFSNNPLKGILS